MIVKCGNVILWTVCVMYFTLSPIHGTSDETPLLVAHANNSNYTLGVRTVAAAAANSVDNAPTEWIMANVERASWLLSGQCREDVQRFVIAFRNDRQWARAMYDASVKVPTGLEYGSLYQFGNFDECLTVWPAIEDSHRLHDDDDDDDDDDNDRIDEGVVAPQYCLADVEMVHGPRSQSTANRLAETTNTTVVHWAICVPASCDRFAVATLLSTLTGYKNVTIAESRCTINESITLSTADIYFGSIICIFFGLVLLSTFYHTLFVRPTIAAVPSKQSRQLGCFEMVVKSFSLYENLKNLVKDSKDQLGLSAINGIKAISMLFIVAGHSLVFMIGGPVLNSEFYERHMKLLRNSFLLNSPLLVDTFLLLSGFLFARLLMLELQKRRGKVNFFALYIFRYIRLTPAYLAMIALYSTWMPKLGSGPLWRERIGVEQERCAHSWWTNLLYINNYVHTDQLCMFQSWYLATDTQLFMLAPLLLYPLYKWRRFGTALLTIMAAISVVIPFAITYANKLDPTFLPYADEIIDLSRNQYFISTYVKTHMRATAYIFGLLAGYLVHVIHERKYRLAAAVQWIGWIVTLIIGAASMMSIVLFFDRNFVTTPLINAMYAGFHRLGWSLATSWIVLCCATGHADRLKRILSMRALVPMSRLTYCAYLTNGLVELYKASTVRVPKHMTVINMFGDSIAHTIMTFLAALMLCLMFESPIHGIEKIFLRRANYQKQAAESDASRSTSEESAAFA